VSVLSLNDSLLESDDQTSIDITDITGEVSVTNPEGWDNTVSGSVLLTDCTAATISISKRNEDGTFTDAPNSPINVYPTLPNIDETPYTITAEAAGYGTDSKFLDGIYKIVYTVANTSGVDDYEFSKTKYFALTGSIDCCYKNLSHKYCTCICNCEGVADKLNKIAIYHRLMESAKCCGNLTALQNYIDYLTAECTECGCGC